MRICGLCRPFNTSRDVLGKEDIIICLGRGLTFLECLGNKTKQNTLRFSAFWNCPVIHGGFSRTFKGNHCALLRHSWFHFTISGSILQSLNTLLPIPTLPFSSCFFHGLPLLLLFGGYFGYQEAAGMTWEFPALHDNPCHGLEGVEASSLALPERSFPLQSPLATLHVIRTMEFCWELHVTDLYFLESTSFKISCTGILVLGSTFGNANLRKPFSETLPLSEPHGNTNPHS